MGRVRRSEGNYTKLAVIHVVVAQDLRVPGQPELLHRETQSEKEANKQQQKEKTK